MSRTHDRTRLRAVPSTISPDDQRVVSRAALDDVDFKLKQIRAIADLIGTVDKETLYEDTIGWAASAICDLALSATATTE